MSAPRAPGGGDPWRLVYEGFDPRTEGVREALCTTGNGYFATRGAAPEARADTTHYPGTYVAGIYNRLTSDVDGRGLEHESLVNVPSWLPLTFRIEHGPWFEAGAVTLLSHVQELDLRRGVLHRAIRFRDAAGRSTRVTQRRLVSMDQPHLAALETRVAAEDWSGTLEVRSALDGAVENRGVARYRTLASRHLEAVATGTPGADVIELSTRTSQSHVVIALAARTTARTGGSPAVVRRRVERREAEIADVLELAIDRGVEVTIEKVAALHTSRDRGISEPVAAGRRAVEESTGFDALLAAHARRWEHLWARAGVDLGRPGREALELRLHVFHLLQTASEHTADLDVGVPARGLHGEAYRGHVFWDDLFVFLALTTTLPELTRSLLRYRHRRLPAARRAAREAGFAGAMFPWQSGSDGREESQRWHLNPRSGRWSPDRSSRQRHIGIAVAYSAWQYYESTGDLAFLSGQGAELILEVARFFGSLAEEDPVRGRYVIRGVMGPDEYHDGHAGREDEALANNAYTNVMAAWTLARAREVLDVLPGMRARALSGELGLDEDELARWHDISRRMFVPFHDDGIISQFEGYGELEELDWEAYRRRYGNIERLDRILDAEGDTPNRYKLSKQADVLMLFFLLEAQELADVLNRLGYPFDTRDIPRTVAYYAARTSHGSTLSRIVHSWVLARADREGSWRLFCDALAGDMYDTQGGTTPEGVHLGAMAGTVDLVQRVYLGIRPRADVLWIEPQLPRELTVLQTTILYRDHWGIAVGVRDGALHVRVPPSDRGPIVVGHRERLVAVAPGESLEIPLSRRVGEAV